MLLETTGRYGEAEPLVRRAVAIAGGPEVLWHMQGNLRAVYARQGRPITATFFGKLSVDALQSSFR